MILKGYFHPCAISSTCERCTELGRHGRLTGSLHFPAREAKCQLRHMSPRRRVYVRGAIAATAARIIRRSNDTACEQPVACPAPPERHPELRRLSRQKLANAKERAL